MDILDIHGQFVVYIGRIHPHRRLSLQSETMSDPIPQLLQDAIQAHKARHHEEAATLYKEILSVRPKHLEASFLYGILAAQTDQEDLAITLLKDVTRRDPKNFEAHRWLAGVLSFRERHDEAEKHARAALHLRPDQVDAIFKLASQLVLPYLHHHLVAGLAVTTKGRVVEMIGNYLLGKGVDQRRAVQTNQLARVLFEENAILGRQLVIQNSTAKASVAKEMPATVCTRTALC